MIMGNDWRDYLDFQVVSPSGMNWEIHGVEGMTGYLVYVWNDDDVDQDMPVPKYYYSKRNGDVYHQDIECFCPGFYEAIRDIETVFYTL